MEFQEFGKIPRLSRECVITEKIDGTNAQIAICSFPVRVEQVNTVNLPYTYAKNTELGSTIILAGSRKKWITPKDDNMGFANWVLRNGEELLKLGEGRHYGEWWGRKIQRGYDLDEKRFSLFNTSKWTSRYNVELGFYDPTNFDTQCLEVPICHVVPVLYKGDFNTVDIGMVLSELQVKGSQAAKDYKNPEGIVIYHVMGNLYFKKTILNDEAPKSLVKGE